MEDAERIVKLAIDNFENRGAEVMIPKQKSPIVAGFGVESVEYHLGGSFRGSYYTLNDNIINGRIRGIGGVVGCNNVRTRHNEGHIQIVKEMISHIDKKRQALGIDKARDRILVDMAARRELETA